MILQIKKFGRIYAEPESTTNDQKPQEGAHDQIVMNIFMLKNQFNLTLSHIEAL